MRGTGLYEWKMIALRTLMMTVYDKLKKLYSRMFQSIDER